MSEVKFKDKSVVIDGKKVQIISGAMHYFRIHPELWGDRLDKAVAFGLNCIETYCCWNLHEPKPGKFNFSGIVDLERYIEMVHERGLYMILRPGPYICAEWENGGFPAWLLAEPGMELRRMNEPYLKAFKRYFDELLPRIKRHLYTNGGPVIMTQIENEYASFCHDTEYLKFIYDLYRSHGIDVPIFTSDGHCGHYLHGGNIPEAMLTMNFGSNSDEAWANHQELRPGEPDFCMEFWNGWFDHWGEAHHTRVAGMEAGGAAWEFDRMLKAGANVNFYMFHGGTNFGFTNGANGNFKTDYAPTVTSYDYDCPLTECGDPSPKFKTCQDVIRKYGDTSRMKEISPSPKVVPPNAKFIASASLFDNLDHIASAHGSSGTPPTMEKLGQNFGFIHYRKRIAGPLSNQYPLRLIEVNDYATVWQDGKFLAHRMRDTGENPVKLNEVPPAGSVIDLLVENCGRINYGPYVGRDFKGIVGGVGIDLQFQLGWEYWSLELEDLSGLKWEEFAPNGGAGFFHKAEFELDETGDAFLFRPGSKGLAWVNGFNLGRYWDKGPTETLYIPSPVLKKGKNTVVVFEQNELNSDEIKFSPELKL